MGRRKKSTFGIRLNGKTLLNLLGFFVILIALIMFASFFQMFRQGDESGQILTEVNQQLFGMFGWLSIMTPIILFLASGHFFNSKKLQFVKYNVTIGVVVLFISLLGLFQTGSWGEAIFDNLSLDFSALGALSILIIGFIVGLILFLDTSIDVIFLAIGKVFAPIGTLFHKISEKPLAIPKLDATGGKQDDGFIKDKIIPAKPEPIKIQQAEVPKAPGNDLSIKPVIQDSSTWVYPPVTLLQEVKQKDADRGDVKANAYTIEKTLESFGIRTRVSEVNFGPTVTQYAMEITMGTKLSKITALGNDLALALAAPTGQVRIEAPIPGRSLVGIEIPNKKPQIVTLKTILESNVMAEKDDPLLVPLGLDVAGLPIVASIAKMPHVLIAGTTGSGKSVMVNAWITTLMMRTRPDELRMILVDPKQVEMTQYNGTPHLLTDVIVDPGKVVSALRWSVGEMEARYKELAQAGVRNLEGFNQLEGVEKKPYIVFVIDELADLMMYAANEVEDLITRIAQKARAVGIHLILSTQRPSVDVITGLMKANIPSRLAFNVSSMIDSRVIIDMPGAEKLLGRGDMFYLPPDQAKPRRIQGPFITEHEVRDVVNFLKAQVPVVHYTEEITQANPSINGGGGLLPGGEENRDAFFNEAIQLIGQSDKASASLLQRKLRIGYARAARILDELEAAGYVGPAEGSKPREVIKRQVQEG
ncbi:MAG TPA: DNA translocase FtsK [Candidatus Woesebacteria bacterium]|nr:DNA translocase FtsK [Candidatus Woesebacteria bacterium]